MCYHGPDLRILLDYRPALRSAPGLASMSTRSPPPSPRRLGPADALTLFSSSWKDRCPRSRCPAPASSTPSAGALLNLAWHRLGWPPVERFAGRSRHRPLAASAAHAGPRARGRSSQCTISTSSITRTHARRDPARLRGARGAARAPRRGRGDHFQLHGRRNQRRLGVAARSDRHCSPGRAGVDAAARSGAARADPVHGHARAAQESGHPARRIRAAAAARMPAAPPLWLAGGATEASAPWLRAIAEPPLEGARTHLGYIDERAPIRSVRAGLDAGAALASRGLRHDGRSKR